MLSVNKYARQIKLDFFGKKGQECLARSKVVIVGVGALGTVSSQLLVRAGVGEIVLIDNDLVDVVNLQRQALFDSVDVGKKKVSVAKEKLSLINPDVLVSPVDDFLVDINSGRLFRDCDLVLDCTDNMAARHVINRACKELGKVWIHAAGSGTKGNVLVVDDFDRFDSLFKGEGYLDECSRVGVLNSLTFMIASLQVTEAFKFLLNLPHCEDLIRFDILSNSYETFVLNSKKGDVNEFRG